MNKHWDNSEKLYFRAETPNDLLATQKPALQIILKNFAKIATDAMKTEPALEPEEVDIQRPHHVFCIDGGRGSGKTYTLLSLQHALSLLNKLCHFDLPQRKSVPSDWQSFFDDPECIGTRPLIALHSAQPRRKSIAHVLRIIFPGDMVVGESLMEMIFASMTDQIDSLLKEEPPSAKIATGANRGELLKKELRDDVERGWYFAKRFGLDAIVRDSIDYADLIERFDSESRASSNRLKAWRTYVDKYLDYLDAATLVILLDDSDVLPELTQDILHSIRMFLNHKRIVTVLAGNLRSMRYSLMHLAINRIASSLTALTHNPRLAEEWQQGEFKAIEDYLEKILPTAQRLVLSQSGSPRYDTHGASGNDFRKVAGDDLLSISIARRDAIREAFLSAQFSLAIKHELHERDLPTLTNARTLEEFLSWWVFTNGYAFRLVPRSPRQIVTFRNFFMYDDFSELTGHPNGEGMSKRFRTKKRLPVALYENTENYLLIQSMGDHDTNIVSWLCQQRTSSEWTGQRLFRINGREIRYDSYSYAYIKYRLDLGLSLPVRYNAEDVIPLGLLPRLTGRRLMRRFFHPGQMPKQQRRYGVARWIDHAAIPGNCKSFYDLSAIPDVSIIPSATDEHAANLLSNGAWEASLSSHWAELWQDNTDERVLRYFTEIVCERVKGTDNVPSPNLILALSPLDVERQYTVSVYERFFRNEIRSFSNEIPDDVWRAAIRYLEQKGNIQTLDLLGGHDLEPGRPLRIYYTSLHEAHLSSKSSEGARLEPMTKWVCEDRGILDHTFFEHICVELNAMMRMIALYTALINDMRRAWHAFRIHELSPNLLEGTELFDLVRDHQRMSLAVIATQRHMPLYSRDFVDRKLLGSLWLGQVRHIFAQEHLVKCLNECSFGLNVNLGNVSLSEVHIGRLFSSKERVASPPRMEIADYKEWMKTLRQVGRVLCAGWPFFDIGPELHELNGRAERRVFGDIAKPFDVSGTGRSAKVRGASHKAIDADLRNVAREMRKFVWLICGISPSLPSIIHTQIAAAVYEAETQYRSFTVGHTDARHDHLAQARAELRDQYEQIVNDIAQWAQLIGVLSIVVRYIKVKCLHLAAKRFIRSLLDDQPIRVNRRVSPDDKSKRTEDERLFAERSEQRKRFLFECGINTRDDKAALRATESLRDIFGVGISDELAFMPDVAPSSLFGDGWMVDLVEKDEIRNLIKTAMPEEGQLWFRSTGSTIELEDKPQHSRGILGDVEQWLWATNRCLRKMDQTMSQTIEDIADGRHFSGPREFLQ